MLVRAKCVCRQHIVATKVTVICLKYRCPEPEYNQPELEYNRPELECYYPEQEYNCPKPEYNSPEPILSDMVTFLPEGVVLGF